MKKLLGILVLGLLWCNVGYSQTLVKIPKDVGSGSKFYMLNYLAGFKPTTFRLLKIL